MWTKICGITNLKDAVRCCDLGADALGFIFYANSPRHVSAEQARIIIRCMPQSMRMVGVVVAETPERIAALAEYCRLDIIQWHGLEQRLLIPKMEYPVWRAVRPQNERALQRWINLQPSTLLFDAYHPQLQGGSGQPANWNWARTLGKRHRVILAGGLNAENIAEAISIAQPIGIDLSTSLESQPGRKDPMKLNQFFHALRSRSSPSLVG